MPRSVIGIGLAAVVAMVAWLPFLNDPLAPDESGFLLLAQHWHPGSSLYGNYWVDRPPLLIWLFALAAHLGAIGHPAVGMTAHGVKILGAIASALSVVLAGIMARLVAPDQPWPRRLTLVAAVALLSSPLLGMPETDGELLAVPFVLLGVVCLIAAIQRGWGRDAALLTAAAGGAAMSAALVKQNVVDVFVFAAILLICTRHQITHLWRRAAIFAGGVIGVLGVALVAADARGTTPIALFDATVVFRLQASAVIRASATSATWGRMTGLAHTAVTSGVVVLLLIAGTAALSARRRHRPDPARSTQARLHAAVVWAALGMALWELCGVALGGSYWRHYLTGLVPGMLLLIALAPPVSRRWLAALAICISYVTVVGAVSWAHHAASPPQMSDNARVINYLRTHAHPSDGVVVAFGQPEIVAGSGLSSPYDELWSLPVRVRDPQLHHLGAVLAGPHAPQWVVVAGDSLGSWGLNATSAQQTLDQHYVDQMRYGDWHVWHHRAGGGIR